MTYDSAPRARSLLCTVIALLETSGPRRRVVALLLACVCAGVLHTRVYTTFERLRFGIVHAELEASDGAVAVQLPDLSSLSGQPVAVVLRLALDGSVSRTARIVVDGSPLADVPLAAGRETRVDLSLPDGAVLSAGDLVEITSDGDGWSLTFLEVANVHGFSRGLFEFMIVPIGVAPAPPVPILLSVALLVLMLLFPGDPTRTVRNTVRRVTYVVVAALVCLFLAAAIVAPWVSDFGVLLAGHTFVVLLVLLYCPTLEVWFWKSQLALLHVWARRVPLLYVASVVLFVAGIAMFHDPETGFTRFIYFNADLQDRLVPALRDVPLHFWQGGYDGQFYAQLAVDPLLLDPATVEALDSPSYRARRILFSWTAFLFGLGQPHWIVHAYAIQNAVFWLVVALLLMRWFPPLDFKSFCLWFGCLFSQGAIFSVVRAVPDAPSLLLLVLTVLAVERGRTGRAAALVGLAGLAKETNLLWSAVLCSPDAFRRHSWRELCVGTLLIAGPLALWMSYVWSGDAVSGSTTGTRNFGLPFTGYFTEWGAALSELREEPSSLAWFNLLALISLGTQAVVLVVSRAWTNAWWRVGIASCALMVVLGPAVWVGYPSAETRVLLPMTVAFNAVLPRNRWFWPVFVLGNLTIISGLDTLNVLHWATALGDLVALQHTDGLSVLAGVA